MSFPVKWYINTMQGAPAISYLPGTVIAWLEACLINGFNRQRLDSLEWDSAQQVLVGENAAGHGFVKYQVVEISRANEAQFNDEYRVVEVTQTRFKLAPNAAPPTISAASGQVEAKAAPVGGWEIFNVNGDRTKADFRSIDPKSTGCVLRVDDSNTADYWDEQAISAMVTLCEGVDEEGGVINPWGYTHRGIRKAYAQSRENNSHPWYLCGDSRLFYCGTSPYNQHANSRSTRYPVEPLMFGDITSFRPGDRFNCIGSFADTSSHQTNNAGHIDLDSANHQIARRYYQELAGDGFAQSTALRGSSITRYFGYGGLYYPNPANNGAFFHTPILVTESYSNDYTVRGQMPGLIQPLMREAPWGFLKILEDVDGLESKLLFAHYVSYDGDSTNNTDRRCYIVLDLDGPWR